MLCSRTISRRVCSGAQGGETLFTNAPNFLKASSPNRIRARDPLTKNALVKVVLVDTDLVNGDRLFVEKTLDRFSPCGYSGDVDPSTLVRQIAVRLRDGLESILAQHATDARRIPLIHLVNAQDERHVDVLFSGELREESMFGRARTTAFLEHQPELAAIHDSTIGQL